MGYQRRVHGDCTRCIQQFNMNKFAVVVCLAAVVNAEADADAALLYGAYGYGGYAAAPYAYGAYPYAAAYAAGYGVTNGANTASIAGLAPAAVPAVAGGMLVLADMSPTPPESSMSPRGLLMPSPRPMLMPTTLDMVDTDTVLAMPDMAMVLATLLPMPTMERGLLMPSLRPMLMLTTMVDTDMVLVMPDMAMVLAMLDTLLPMVAMPTTERGLLMPSPRLMLLFSMELTAMVVFMVDMAMLLPMPMVPTPTPMLPTDMASKKSSAFSLIV